MMNVSGWWKRASIGVVALFLMFQAGCSSTVEPGDHPRGIVLVGPDGGEAARFQYPEAISGELSVTAGASVTYRVRVVTESGAVVDLDGEEYSIGEPRVVNPMFANVTLQGDDEIVVTGVAGGATTLFFPLRHGGHTEFEVKDIPLAVQNVF